MALPQRKERRISFRRRLSGLMPGKLVYTSETGEVRELICKPIDISMHGLGALSKTELPEGTQIVMHVRDVELLLEVASVRQDFGKQDMFRYGLVTQDQDENLEDLFSRTGCLA